MEQWELCTGMCSPSPSSKPDPRGSEPCRASLLTFVSIYSISVILVLSISVISACSASWAAASQNLGGKSELWGRSLGWGTERDHFGVCFSQLLPCWGILPGPFPVPAELPVPSRDFRSSPPCPWFPHLCVAAGH